MKSRQQWGRMNTFDSPFLMPSETVNKRHSKAGSAAIGRRFPTDYGHCGGHLTRQGHHWRGCVVTHTFPMHVKPGHRHPSTSVLGLSWFIPSAWLAPLAGIDPWGSEDNGEAEGHGRMDGVLFKTSSGQWLLTSQEPRVHGSNWWIVLGEGSEWTTYSLFLPLLVNVYPKLNLRLIVGNTIILK